MRDTDTVIRITGANSNPYGSQLWDLACNGVIVDVKRKSGSITYTIHPYNPSKHKVINWLKIGWIKLKRSFI